MTDSLAAPTLPEIERAMDEVVSALVAYRNSPPEACSRALAARAGRITVTSATAMSVKDLPYLAARDLVKRPVEVGLKQALTRLGKLAHELVGDKGLRELAERVANLEPTQAPHRLFPIDKAFDGIGSWYA